EFLLDRLREKHPGRPQELSSRVAAWFAEQGKAEQAIDYYLAGEEYETAIDLIAQQVSEVVQHRGHHDVLFRWLEKMPAQYLQRQPKVSICYAWSLIFSRHLDRVEEALSNIQQNHIPVSKDPHNSSESNWIQWNLGMLDAMFDLMYGRVVAAHRKTSDWLVRWPDAPEFERGVVLGVHGISCIHVLDLVAAKKAQREARTALARSDSDYGVSWMSFLHGQILCLQGRVTEARHFLEDAFAVAQQQMGSRSVGAQLLKLGLGHVSYITHDTERARQYFEFSLESIAEHGSVDSILMAFLSQSNLQFQQGQKQASLELLHKAETYGERLNLSHFQLSVVDQRIQRVLAEENPQQARQLFSDHGLDKPESNSDQFTELESLQIALLTARFQLADRSSDKAIESTASLMDFCGKHGLLIEYLRSGVLQARALYDNGEANKAYRLLQKLFATASDNMLLSPFLEEQYYLAPLWPDFFKRYGTAPETDASRIDFVQRLTQALNISELVSIDAEGDSDTAQPLEALSGKEQEILRYLNQGLSNKELAETLFVSVSTIKWHLTHIYAKLGVKSRVEAIKAYQVLGL
ncbi:MAG: LuxR C-terminal-related transcriptional regulator, partial [Pseudomonadota bacterium]|nr:LuxR C-terminal-related transcriptional regulator [Pseudomonadota bacterium]